MLCERLLCERWLHEAVLCLGQPYYILTTSGATGEVAVRWRIVCALARRTYGELNRTELNSCV